MTAGVAGAAATAFVASFCTLVLELVAGRVLAPKLGTSLYTWTSTLGVVLAGISIGNYLGGRLADRRATPGALAAIFLAASATTLAILGAVALFLEHGLPQDIPLLPRTLLINLLLFFAPTLILGMVSPVLVRRVLDDLRRTGRTVGTIYAWSTAGSILGTFATGFVLIEALGTRLVVLAVAATLLLTAVLAGELWRRPRRLGALGAAALVVAAALYTLRGQLLTPPCDRETSYFCIKVVEFERDALAGRQAALVLDHLVHSRVSLDDPTQLGYSYLQAYADVTALVVRDKPAFTALLIGGGGYGLPRYLDAVYPRAQVHVIEIDPRVTEISYRELGLERNTRITPHHDDARSYLMHWHDAPRFEVIYGDAFNDLSMPYHLTTVEFDRMLFDMLTDDGVYLANVIDNYRDGEILRAFMNTVGEVFPHVSLVRWGPYAPSSIETLVVVASKRPLALDRLDAPDPSGRSLPRTVLSRAIEPAEIAAYRQAGRRIILTDDYAPIEQLTARLFLMRGY